MKRLWALALAVLVAGCLVEKDNGDGDGGDQLPPGSDGPGPGQGFAPQQGTAHGSAGGIAVNVTWRACEAGFCANATATNQGAATVRISSICESPWFDRMESDGQSVRHREPQAICLAYGRADFAPGEKAYADFTWDQKVHDEAGAHDAPEGPYDWSIVFWWEAQDGGPRQEAEATIHLVVGET